MEVLIICGIYTHHVAVFCGLYLLSSDVSKNISFNVGFIGNYIKGNLVTEINGMHPFVEKYLPKKRSWLG